MKKEYKTPQIDFINVSMTSMISISVLNGEADNGEVLTKEDDSWDIWQDGDVEDK